MTVKQLAKRLGIPAHIVRYYTRIGLLRPACDPHNGYHRYGAADEERLRFIRGTKSLGLSLRQIGRLLAACERDGGIGCGELRSLLARRLAEVQREVAALRQLEGRIEGALRCCLRVGGRGGDIGLGDIDILHEPSGRIPAQEPPARTVHR